MDIENNGGNEELHNDDGQQGNNEPTPEIKAPEPKKEVKHFTKRERLEYQRSKIDQELDSLDEGEDDNRPLTVGEFKKLQQQQAKATALDLADSINDEDERAEVKTILESRLVPSGNADADLKEARAIANARKNAQLAEEALRKQNPKRDSSGSGAPRKGSEEVFEPTPAELNMMQGFGLTKEDVLKARKATEQAER